jgi:predicted RNA-binding Zn-ribbon protein involved in translation (DUF1610 family)
MITKRKPPRRPRGGATYLCPKCGSPTRVERTRRVGRVIVRTRSCPQCAAHAITHEAPAPAEA